MITSSNDVGKNERRSQRVIAENVCRATLGHLVLLVAVFAIAMAFDNKLRSIYPLLELQIFIACSRWALGKTILREKIRLPRLWKIFLICAGAQGALWGAIASTVLSDPSIDPTTTIFIFTILSGVTAAAVFTLAPNRVASTFYLIGALGFPILSCFSLRGPMHVLLAISLILYAIFNNMQSAQRSVEFQINCEREDRLQALVELTTEAIFLVRNDKIVDVNPAALKMFQLDRDDIETLKFSALVPLLDGQPERFAHVPYRGIRSDGKQIPIRSSQTTVSHKGSPTQVISIRDISESVAHERSLQESREAALATARSKSAFLANMSHEIRTPLGGMIGMIDLLSELESTQLQRKYLRTLRESGDHLLRIVNDILDLSKIEARQMKFEQIEFNLSTLIEKQISLLQSRADLKNITLISTNLSEGAGTLIGDPSRLSQVVLNLLTNAIKFTDRGFVQAEFRIRRTGVGRSIIRLVVRDTGIGMSAQTCSHLFQPFSQADTSISRIFGGTGLGLAISAQLIRLMNGKVKVRSRLGEGSEFILLIPFGSVPCIALAQSTADDQTMVNSTGVQETELVFDGGPKILVAEDNSTNQLFLAASLKRMGVDFCIVENGEKVIEAVKQNDFDLILMDCQMPIMNGFEATKEIRRINGPKREIPIIALTANAMPEDQKRCLRSGMNDFVSKPIRRKELHAVIKKFLPAKMKVAA